MVKEEGVVQLGASSEDHLSSFAKYKKFSTVDKQDTKDLAKNNAIGEEYNKKRIRNHKKAKLIAFKPNQFRDKVTPESQRSRVCKVLDVKPPLQKVKQQRPGDGISTAKPFSDVATSHV